MTEVPEYLLRRSRERREALGLGTGGGDALPPAESAPPPTEPAAAAAVPAPAAPSAPAPAPAPSPPTPVVPPPPRSGIPAWIYPVLAILPFWAVVYVGALAPPERTERLTPIQLGARTYAANCVSCHGASGEGVGVNPKLAGDVLKTFPIEADHVKWVQEGSQTKPKGTVYGDPNREGGAHTVQQQAMPGFAGTLSPEELSAVVLYERETFK